MAFNKVGSPQPLEVMSELCQKCGLNKAEFNVNGMFVCVACKEELEKQTKEQL